MIREKIIEELRSRGISNRRCALDCGIIPQNFQEYIAGKRTLPVTKIETVLNYLNIILKNQAENTISDPEIINNL